MSKKFLTLTTIAIILGGTLTPTDLYALQSSTIAGCGGHERCMACVQGGGIWNDGEASGDSCKGGTEGDKGSLKKAAEEVAGSFVFEAFARGIGAILMSLTGGILAIVGFFFDLAVKHTIIDMAGSLGDPKGLGGSISQAWSTLVGVANMAFIFVLLYVAFKYMFKA